MLIYEKSHSRDAVSNIEYDDDDDVIFERSEKSGEQNSEKTKRKEKQNDDPLSECMCVRMCICSTTCVA